MLETYILSFIPVVGAFLMDVLLTLAAFWVSTKVIKWICNTLSRFLKMKDADPSVSRFLVSFSKAGLYFLVIATLATQLGIKEASIVALIGSMGVGLSLALQGGMANLAGGVLILLLKPFKLGDYIIEGTHNMEGTVKKIDMFYTTLTTIDNRLIIIPNGQLTNGCVVNVTAQSKRQLDMKVMISYEDDLKKAKEIAENLLARDERIISEDGYRVFVDCLDDHGVVIGCRAWVSTDNYWNVRWEWNENIKLAFDEAGIHIPFNQLDVHVSQIEHEK